MPSVDQAGTCLQGTIEVDCIFKDGSMSCPSPGGDWAKCASKTRIPQPRVPLVRPEIKLCNQHAVCGTVL